MSRKEIEEQIKWASDAKEEAFHEFDNYFLASLSMLFGLSASFLAQIYITKNPDLIDDIFLGSLFLCLVSGGIVLLTIRKTQKRIERNHNKILELCQEYLKEWKKEERHLKI